MSQDSTFPGIMENKSSLEAATSLLCTVSECLEDDRFFFQARTNCILFFLFFFSFLFLKYILLPDLDNWPLSQQEEQLLENACVWREEEKDTQYTLQESVPISQDLSGLFVPICCTTLCGAKQTSQVPRISSPAGLDGKEQKKA